MSITFHCDQKIVHISNDTISYVMEVVAGKYLVHRYFRKENQGIPGDRQSLLFQKRI